MEMERVDDYKHRYEFYTEAAEVKRGQAYPVGDGWKVTSKPKVPPYHRPRQKRQDVGIIQKELEQLDKGA